MNYPNKITIIYILLILQVFRIGVEKWVLKGKYKSLTPNLFAYTNFLVINSKSSLFKRLLLFGW